MELLVLSGPGCLLADLTSSVLTSMGSGLHLYSAACLASIVSGMDFPLVDA